MNLTKIRKLFAKGNVSVFGNCGSGKDLLFSNVAVRSKGYVSNNYYGGNFEPLDFSFLDVSKNTYVDFIECRLKPYTYPYPIGHDIFVTDCGVYFPSQYCNELNKRYPYLPTFFAIRRHLGNCNIHYNTQALNRVWDKLREQSDTYILCRWAKVFFGKICIQKITVYDRLESAQNRIKPCRVRNPLLGTPNSRMQAQIAIDNFANSHGEVRNLLLIYWNKSKYDTHHFKKLLEDQTRKENITND